MIQCYTKLISVISEVKQINDNDLERMRFYLLITFIIRDIQQLIINTHDSVKPWLIIDGLWSYMGARILGVFFTQICVHVS